MSSLYRDQKKNLSFNQYDPQTWSPSDLPSPSKMKKSVLDYESTMRATARSRKDRLKFERDQEIVKNNLILYEKIKKIMTVNEKLTKKQKEFIENPKQQENLHRSANPKAHKKKSEERNKTNYKFPMIKLKKSTSLFSTRDSAHRFTLNPEPDSPTLTKAHRHKQEEIIGIYESYGWKIIAETINYGEILLLSASKGKRKVNKQFFYEKVKEKLIEEDLQEWIKSKFQFEI